MKHHQSGGPGGHVPVQWIDLPGHAGGSQAHLQGAVVTPGGGVVEQMSELADTINAAPCELVLIATPIDLGKLLVIDKPALRVRYELKMHDDAALVNEIKRTVS